MLAQVFALLRRNKLRSRISPWHLVYASSALTPGTVKGAPAGQDGTAAELARSTTGHSPRNLTGKSAPYKLSKTSAISTTSPAECARSFCPTSPRQQSEILREHDQSIGGEYWYDYPCHEPHILTKHSTPGCAYGIHTSSNSECATSLTLVGS